MIYLVNKILNKEWVLPLKIWRIIFRFEWRLFYRNLSEKQYFEMKLKKCFDKDKNKCVNGELTK